MSINCEFNLLLTLAETKQTLSIHRERNYTATAHPVPKNQPHIIREKKKSVSPLGAPPRSNGKGIGLRRGPGAGPGSGTGHTSVLPGCST